VAFNMKSGQIYDLNEVNKNVPRMERLRQPNLSPERESVPHCRTTADGLYDCMTCVMICRSRRLSYQLRDTQGKATIYRLENLSVIIICNTIPKRNVAGVCFPFANPGVL
jgi:hypothetical protein